MFIPAIEVLWLFQPCVISDFDQFGPVSFLPYFEAGWQKVLSI